MPFTDNISDLSYVIVEITTASSYSGIMDASPVVNEMDPSKDDTDVWWRKDEIDSTPSSDEAASTGTYNAEQTAVVSYFNQVIDFIKDKKIASDTRFPVILVQASAGTGKTWMLSKYQNDKK